jgi:Xaa-Pro aminopeptidase
MTRHLPPPYALQKLDTGKFQSRRAQLLAWMHSQGGGIAVIASAPERARNRDNIYTYRHDSDFFYLTGFTEPQAWLILIAGDQDQSILFCLSKDEEQEIWNGVRWGPEAAAEHFGFDRAEDVETLDRILPALLTGHPRLFTTMSRPAGPELVGRLQGWVTHAATTSRGTRATPHHWLDLSEELAEMRLIKDATEQQTMRTAGKISAQGHVRAMQAAKPGMHEYELEAELLYTFRKHGAQAVAYNSIVAAGANACILHHAAGNSVMRDGDLVLIDAGCELDGYASDITRTFPANGKFSGPQRALYDIVLAAQYAAIAQTSPAHHWNAGHEAAVSVLTQGLLDVGILKGSLEQAIETAAYRPFYMHRTGHWLGMDVHDVGSYRIPPATSTDRPWRMLQAGMVLTIEPGLYVRPAENIPEEFWNIGIRIEDDAIITEQGCELITRDVPVDADEIERLMRA